MKVDHWDGDGLNCRRGNLRAATHAQNLYNRGPQQNNKSGYKGVSWSRNAKKWWAHIQVDKKVIHLGYFDVAEQAARAYDVGALKYHGSFAKTNFVEATCT